MTGSFPPHASVPRESSFVHLHNHTEYSMLDGAAKIAPMLAEVDRLQMPAVGMTDHGNMFGASEFYNAATKAGIKPIIGVEAYIAPASRRQSRTVISAVAAGVIRRPGIFTVARRRATDHVPPRETRVADVTGR